MRRVGAATEPSLELSARASVLVVSIWRASLRPTAFWTALVSRSTEYCSPEVVFESEPMVVPAVGALLHVRSVSAHGSSAASLKSIVPADPDKGAAAVATSSTADSMVRPRAWPDRSNLRKVLMSGEVALAASVYRVVEVP